MKATGFTELAEPEVEDNGDECGWRHDICDSLAFEYFGAWIEESGEFGDDRWVVECMACSETAELR